MQNCTFYAWLINIERVLCTIEFIFIFSANILHLLLGESRRNQFDAEVLPFG